MIKKILILSTLTACITPSIAGVTNLPLGGVYYSETQIFKLGDFETKAENMVIKGNSFGFDVAPENIPLDLRSSLGKDVNIKKGKVLFTSEDSRAILTAALVADEGIALTEMTIKGSKSIEQTESIDELIDEMSGFKSRTRIHYTSGSIIDKATSDIKKSGCELSEQGLSLSLELSHDRNTALLKPNASLDEVLKTFNGMTASWNLEAGGVANHSTAFSLNNDLLHITNNYIPVCTTFDPTLNTDTVNKVRSSLLALPAFAGQYPTLVSTISAIGGYAIKVLESPNMSVYDDISIDVKKGVQEATLLSGNVLNGAISNLITANQPNNN